MLELINVTKRYPTPANNEQVTVLDNINLKVDDGQCLAIVGPSGCGKSTLLNIVGALDVPTSGEVVLSGEKFSSLNSRQLARIRNQQIGFVFQLHHLLPQCTVLENVLVPTLAGNGEIDSKQQQARAVELLTKVGLKENLLYRPGQLSGGQRQRIAVIRALINKPSLLLADEPTGSLDSKSSENIADLLAKLNETEKVTMIVVTHSLKLASRMGKVLILEDGSLSEGALAQ